MFSTNAKIYFKAVPFSKTYAFYFLKIEITRKKDGNVSG
jgi:hypothetical protein